MKITVKEFKLVKIDFNPSDMFGEPKLDVWGGVFNGITPISFEINKSKNQYRVSPHNGSELKNSEWKIIPHDLQKIIDEQRSEFEWTY